MEDAEGDAEEVAVDKKVNHINKYCKSIVKRNTYCITLVIGIIYILK